MNFVELLGKYRGRQAEAAVSQKLVKPISEKTDPGDGNDQSQS